jgi:hypothetical protein
MNHVCGHEHGVLTARTVLQALTTIPQRRSSGASENCFHRVRKTALAHCPRLDSNSTQSMIPESGHRFSEKIMLKGKPQNSKGGYPFECGCGGRI